MTASADETHCIAVQCLRINRADRFSTFRALTPGGYGELEAIAQPRDRRPRRIDNFGFHFSHSLLMKSGRSITPVVGGGTFSKLKMKMSGQNGIRFVLTN